MKIPTYDLFIVQKGIESAMYPHLYPTTDFTDTGIMEHYKSTHDDDKQRVCSIGLSWTRKVLSSVRLYGEQVNLPFFLYEKFLANKYFCAHVRAKSMGVTADVMARDSQASAGYWEIVQDGLADLVRIQLDRCCDPAHDELYNHCSNLRGETWLCAFPNVFITVAPAEWKFPRPYFLQPYMSFISGAAYIMALHMYWLVFCIWKFIANEKGNRFFRVFEWCMKTEYQGRGTPHWHIAAWVVCAGNLRLLAGRTGTAVVSGLVYFLHLVFRCEVDVQIGNGRLNYINGYVSKDHDAVDVGLGEYVQKDASSSWLATYRLLCKPTPGLPEVAIRMAQLSEFEKSYAQVLLYPPQPEAMQEMEGRKVNFSARMYGFYVREKRQQVQSGTPISDCWLKWHRGREYSQDKNEVLIRSMGQGHSHKKTQVVACRYWYELTDGYWGQLSITQLPHLRASDLLPYETHHLNAMKNFVGMIEYLSSWRWSDDRTVKTESGVWFTTSSLPTMVSDSGTHETLATLTGSENPGDKVFEDDEQVFKYMMAVATRDLQYRGMRDDRLASFRHKQRANFLMYRDVTQVTLNN